jgi:hypothetical protein
MPLQLNWRDGEYRVPDPYTDFGGIVLHEWSDRRKLHEGYIAKVGRTTHDPRRHWLNLGTYIRRYMPRSLLLRSI